MHHKDAVQPEDISSKDLRIFQEKKKSSEDTAAAFDPSSTEYNIQSLKFQISKFQANGSFTAGGGWGTACEGHQLNKYMPLYHCEFFFPFSCN